MSGGITIIKRLARNREIFIKNREEKTVLILITDGTDQTGEVKVLINGEKAKVQILGIVIGSEEARIHLYTLQDHLKGQSMSDLMVKSILFDKARFNYEGLIKIEKGAQKSDAYQKNQNLIMSSFAWADSRPYLEIEANDVRCTHGATVGKVDKNQLYYLQSRGLRRKSATKLLIEGYLSDVIERIPDENVKREVRIVVAANIDKLLKRSNY